LNKIRFEPFLRKAVQNIVRKYDPEYVDNTRNDGNGLAREFWLSWYGIPGILR